MPEQTPDKQCFKLFLANSPAVN